MGERLLDDAGIAELRSVLEANLTHTCDIQTDSTAGAPGTGGVVKPVWASQALPLTPCQMTQGSSSSLTEHNDQPTSLSTHRVRFAAGKIVTEKNRLVVTGVNAGLAFNKTLTVLGVTHTPTATIADCREATAGER